MSDECALKDGVILNKADVAKIAMGLKSLAAYSMLAYDHEEDPKELQEVVDEGLAAIEKLFVC